MEEIVERIIRARNSLGELAVKGIDDARKLTNIYDHLTQTAQIAAMMYEKEKGENRNESQKPEYGSVSEA